MSFPWESKTYVFVFGSAAQMFKELPSNRFAATILQAVLNNGKLSDYITYNSLTNYAAQLTDYFEYGRDKHIYGLPASSFTNTFYKVDQVNAVLASLEAAAVSIYFSELSTPTIYNWGRYWLQQNEPAFDYNNNTITISTVAWQIDNIRQLNNTQFIVDLQHPTIPESTSTYGPITSLPNPGIYYSVEYELVSAPGIRKIWLYEAALTTHPTLTETELPDNSGVYPIIPIRLNDVNIMDSALTDLYNNNKQIMRTVKLDYDTISLDITSTLNEDGSRSPIPDLNLISDIFYFYAINIYGQSQQEKRALFFFFDSLYNQARFSEASFDAYVASGTVQVAKNSFFVNSGNFDFDLLYNFIRRDVFTGVIATKGEYVVDFVIVPDTTINHSEAGAAQIINRRSLRLRKQDTHDTYTEIYVDGLIFSHSINTIRGPRNLTVEIEAYTAGTELNDNQKMSIIPFNSSFFNSLDTREGDSYIPISAHIMIYASDSQKVSGWDRFVSTVLAPILKIVSVVLFITSIGTAQTVSQALWSVAKFLAFQYAFEYVLRELLIEFSGNETAQALIVLAASYVSYKFAASQLEQLSTADQLLLATNSLTNSVNLYTSTGLDLLYEEADLFFSDAKEYEKEIEEASKFLEVRGNLDITSAIFAANQELDYETPTEFYARTLNTAPGQLVFDQLHNYVDNNLNLTYI